MKVSERLEKMYQNIEEIKKELSNLSHKLGQEMDELDTLLSLVESSDDALENSLVWLEDANGELKRGRF